jgi:hypothetical protein
MTKRKSDPVTPDELPSRPVEPAPGPPRAPDHAPEPVCACCGEPGDVLRAPLMMDRYKRLVHRACRDQSDWRAV